MVCPDEVIQGEDGNEVTEATNERIMKLHKIIQSADAHPDLMDLLVSYCI